MNSTVSKYWIECIECAFDAAGVSATQEQILQVAGDVETSHGLYGMAHGYECIPNPLEEENRKLKQRLEDEQRKVVCPTCKGRGRVVHPGPYHSADMQCGDCHGDGYRLP